MGCNMAVIQIGTIKSMREPEGFGCTPDDRQELIQCIDGVCYVDAGYHPEGDVFSCTAIFKPADWVILKGYWQGRVKVDITDQQGEVTPQIRVVVKKYEPISKHKYWKITMEFWRV